ncbi:Ail/Lom family outer membrane beta-barrel protein, partial [Helicobacter pylori]|uniref:Ail/Lom family outer membrane beta-barrel protein n=1 Tax=Helicobacter pylori TaxID=210 RepID=UPI001EE3EE47
MRNVCIAVAVFAALAVTVTPARAEGGHGTFTVGYFQVKPGTLPSLSGGDTGVSHLKGINVKYRYELTDSVGVMASLGLSVIHILRYTRLTSRSFRRSPCHHDNTSIYPSLSSPTL